MKLAEEKRLEAGRKSEWDSSSTLFLHAIVEID